MFLFQWPNDTLQLALWRYELVINPGQWFLKFELWINGKTCDYITHNDSMAVKVIWSEPLLSCPGLFRRSTKQRELPGTTSTTQTTWAASISSARSPPGCFTCWMRRASKTMRKSSLIFTSLKIYPFIFFGNVFFFIIISMPQLSPCHRWDIISQI